MVIPFETVKSFVCGKRRQNLDEIPDRCMCGYVRSTDYILQNVRYLVVNVGQCYAVWVAVNRQGFYTICF